MKKFLKKTGIALVILLALSAISTAALNKKAKDLNQSYSGAHYDNSSLSDYARHDIYDVDDAMDTEAVESEPDPNEGRTIAYIFSVVDGDTFCAYVEGLGDAKFRLIGVDTPESVHSDDSKNVPEGKKAAKYTADLLPVGKPVYLEFDVSEMDMYGRYLVYVYLPNGEMINEILLREGYAKTMTVAPNVKYADRFIEIQKTAEESGAGFWHELSDLFAANETN